VMFFLLFFIVIVAGFGIMSTLITVTVQKRHEIGIVKALGEHIAQSIEVFLGQGTIVGLFGTIPGLGLGMTLIRYRNEFSRWLASTLHIEIFPREVYQFSSIPAEVIPHDVAIICISAFLICSFAALIPAYFAARLDPVKALRYEERCRGARRGERLHALRRLTQTPLQLEKSTQRARGVIVSF